MAFIMAFGEEVNAGRSAQAVERTRLETERGTVVRRLDRLYDAIADGLRTPCLKEKLTSLEDRRAERDVRSLGTGALSGAPTSQSERDLSL